MNIHFILYRPAVPGNVGSAARAIKTMGFSSLRLIRPCNHLSDEARMFAHGSADILENALVYKNFEEAVSGIEFIVSTTARRRSAKYDYYSSRELRGLLNLKAAHLQQVGILFGTEESGLPNSLILQSDLAVSVPMEGPYPSLNLAQAVMVIAYELSPFHNLQQPGQGPEKSSEGWGELKKQAHLILEKAGIPEGSPLFHRIMERLARTGSDDIPLFLSVIKRLNARWSGPSA